MAVFGNSVILQGENFGEMDFDSLLNALNSGLWVSAAAKDCPDVADALLRCADMCHEINMLPPSKSEKRNELLKSLLGKAGNGLTIHSPFRCDFGFNIRIGDNFVGNFNLSILDEAEVTIGDNVMIGYYKNKDASAAAFTPDGWLHTGDMGIMDADGNIFIKGRCKNMVLGPNGQNIYPEEIEDKLNSHRYVTESIVVARGNRLVALVYPDTDAIIADAAEHKHESGAVTDSEALVSAAMDALLADVNKSLPAYSKLSKAEVMATEFEKTPKKSIKRFLYE